MSNIFVFRPGAEQPLPTRVFNTWATLMKGLTSSTIGGRKVIEFDDSIKKCVIPTADSPYEMKDVSWAGFGPRSGKPRAIVEIRDGARFKNLRMMGGQITIINKAKKVSPISDFPVERPDDLVDQVHIGLRDDCGSTHIVNRGTVPLFEIGRSRAFFFLQNCLFGVSAFGESSTSPLIHVRGNGRGTNPQLAVNINLLGQSVLGPNVVRAKNGAIVQYGAISLAAQIAAVQGEVTNPESGGTGGVLKIRPLGRIQREIVPLPPTVGPIPPETIGVPNALIRCNGLVPSVQTLPKIVGGFRVVPADGIINLYSGGQELVVAEVNGGTKLSVAPSRGDTIDGRKEPVPMGPNGSRTFVSDGKSNWITISVVHGRISLVFPFDPEPGGVI